VVVVPFQSGERPAGLFVLRGEHHSKEHFMVNPSSAANAAIYELFREVKRNFSSPSFP
jgi:hypothetical protein